jgi:hypothetical protein
MFGVLLAFSFLLVFLTSCLTSRHLGCLEAFHFVAELGVATQAKVSDLGVWVEFGRPLQLDKRAISA